MIGINIERTWARYLDAAEMEITLHKHVRTATESAHAVVDEFERQSRTRWREATILRE